MYSMQYSVPLPTDYDMQIIRDRVARSGHLLDGFPGLNFKAYLIREKETGAPGNEYAPFYLWDDIDGMRRFCLDDPGYSSIVRDFGRRPIQDWTVIDVAHGPADLEAAQVLTLSEHTLPAGAAPSAVVPTLTGPFLDSPTTRTARRIAAVDVTTWTVILVEIGTEADPAGTDGARYEVLHVSVGATPRAEKPIREPVPAAHR